MNIELSCWSWACSYLKDLYFGSEFIKTLFRIQESELDTVKSQSSGKDNIIQSLKDNLSTLENQQVSAALELRIQG